MSVLAGQGRGQTITDSCHAVNCLLCPGLCPCTLAIHNKCKSTCCSLLEHDVIIFNHLLLVMTPAWHGMGNCAGFLLLFTESLIALTVNVTSALLSSRTLLNQPFLFIAAVFAAAQPFPALWQLPGAQLAHDVQRCWQGSLQPADCKRAESFQQRCLMHLAGMLAPDLLFRCFSP